MNTSHSTPPPASRACATFEPLLPLAAHGLLDAAHERRTRDHLAGCAHCRAELAAHHEVDAVLRATFAVPAGALPPFSPRDVRAMRSGVPAHATAPAPARSVRPPRRPIAALPVVAAVALIVVFARLFFVWHSGPPVGITATPLALPANSVIRSVSMVSPDEGWAAGSAMVVSRNPGGGTAPFTVPLMLHYLHGRWSSEPLPAGVTAGFALTSVSMVSPDDGWAVGNTVFSPYVDGYGTILLLHYTGGRWTLTTDTFAAPLALPTQIVMRSPDDGWLVGQASRSGAVVFHYDGHIWAPVTAPALASFNPWVAAAASPTAVWIAGTATDFTGVGGFDGNDPETIVHYDGTTWSRQNLPDPRMRITSMAMLSPSEGWAVGVLPRPVSASGAGDATQPDNSIILRYHDGRWDEYARIPGPTASISFSLDSVAMVSASDGWAVGVDGTILHYTGGVWVRVSGPTTATLRAVAMWGPADGWAMGDGGTILRYAGGAWTLYH